MTVGSQLAGGRYSVRGKLGEGAQGVTFDAVGTDGRAYAVKRFDVRGARSWKDVELAERETRVLATLDHPLVPRYVEHFEEDGALYLVMEKVEGESLDSLLRRTGALPEVEVRRFLRCADRALSYLHGRAAAIVHRDIKPRNVIRRANGDYVFVDFGVVAERLQRTGGGSTVVGTAGFMAPEQLQGRALPVTDVYAVGATALAALAGQEPDMLPHRGLRLDARAALAGRPVSEGLITALESMLEPDPSLRAADVASSLEGAGAPQPSFGSVAPVRFSSATRAEEDAMVKSVRKLVWVLWGISWCVVMPAADKLHAGDFGAALMVLALIAVLILTWHKGYLLRAVLRKVQGIPADEPVRLRVDAPSPRARVHVGGGPFHDAAQHGVTEVEAQTTPAARRATY